MKVTVLGAGVTGITSAWFLHQAGHEVTVIDRQPGAGMETSFANGGQVSVSHAEPWANPGAPLKVLKWLMREDAPLLFRLRPDLNQWLWGLDFLRQCTPGRTRHNIKQMVNLGLYSRATLQNLRAATGIDYQQKTEGILHFYTSEKEYADAQAPAALMREYGCELDMKTPDECIAIEPALAASRGQLVGGSMTASDESGDAHQFTAKLAALCASAGVEFLYNTRIVGARREGGALAGVQIANADGIVSEVQSDAYVMCLGAYSPQWAKLLGQTLRIYPAKGYSVTLPVINEAASFNVSLTDDEYKLVFSRLGNRLRIAGTAELGGYNTDLNLVRCEAIVRRVRQLFPEMTDGQNAQYWTGLRPATPSNVPYIGASTTRKLFLNTGHGTLGWTHACGSGAAIADIVSGRVPEVDFAFTGLAQERRQISLGKPVAAQP
ncbi:D-amino acid dehydrogenase [Polaromonas sp. A23]|uniref:D-amino acid dehydrogenase n=1 Tax=Polaromonas sp. A23 TaxID=1944133 RepID=UPI0009841A12|nr:D-amino acid dehydrogenase [Polaromonas sp. A23]OOG46580.1 amino acid dehydrogenase [Polaromonas sp. A23]